MQFRPRSPVAIIRGALLFSLLFVPLLANAQSSYTWTGGGSDNDWSTGLNWSGGTAPSNPQAYLNFAGSTGLTSNNNLSDFGPGFQIYFNNGAGAFTLTGNAINFYDYNGNSPLIQNDSTSLQTVSIKQIDAEVSMNLNATSGSLTFTSPFYLDSSATLTANASTSKTITFSGSINNGGSSTGRVTLSGAGLTVFGAANTYTGETDINAGTLRVDVAPSSATSTYYVGSGGATTASAALYLGNGSTGGLTFSNAVSENTGSGSNRIIGGSNTGGTNTYTGNITISDGNANLRAATGGTTAFNTITALSAQTVAINGAAGYAGTVSLAGTSDNLNIGATVNSGTLSLAKTSNSGVHAVGAGLTVNGGGTVILGGTGGDQIYNAMSMTLNGGTFNSNSLSEGTQTNAGIGALTLQSSSVIDLVGTSILHFAASSSATAGTILSILDWNGTAGTGGGSELIKFGSANTDLGYISQVQFVNPAGFAPGTYSSIFATGDFGE